MEKLRPYVCVAVNNFTRGTYPVHRIDASGLFYQKDQGKVTTTPPVEHPLPRPCISFSPSPCRSGCGVLDFLGLFGLCQKRNLLAAVDYQGVSRVYDVDDCIVNITPAPQEPKCCEPVSIDLGGAFYVLDRQLIPGRQKCFEALTFGPPNLFGTPRWHWRSIQPPPFIFDPGYETTRIGAYTVVGDSSIMISTPLGTYTFDTMSSSWDKAGDWELPFHGRVEFFPKYGAWLGFSAQDNRLCYSSKASTGIGHGLG
nr:unnamed protein product [Digitaria exilis]